MGNYHGLPGAKTKKATEDFTKLYYPAKLDSNGNVEMVDANTDPVYTIVQNKPKEGMAAACPKPGETVKFIIGAGGLTPGQSAKLSEDSSEQFKLKAITIDLSAPANSVQRIVIVENGGIEDQIGTGVLMLDYVPI